jgi:hypothetical protein
VRQIFLQILGATTLLVRQIELITIGAKRTLIVRQIVAMRTKRQRGVVAIGAKRTPYCVANARTLALGFRQPIVARC